MTDPARAAAEAAARASYGRLVAWLAARTRDVAAAEDALADAFAAALRTWPARGVPDRPEAWLLTTARRNLGHAARHRLVRAAAAPTLHLLATAAQDRDEAGAFPDERLKLLFVCAHPAIDPAMHTPLMLQSVLGLDAARIAAAFVVAPAAMGQRLVRAKAKIRDAGIRFAVPGPADLPARLAPVLDAVYAAFGTAWDAPPRGEEPGGPAANLGEEAIWLARLIASLLPEEPEALGLLALLLHCQARQPARRDAAGFVPLSAQDPALWSAPLIAEAEAALLRACALGRIGRFQLEAAIQSAHAGRARGAAVDWVGSGGRAVRGAAGRRPHAGRTRRPRRRGGRGGGRAGRPRPAGQHRERRILSALVGGAGASAGPAGAARRGAVRLRAGRPAGARPGGADVPAGAGRGGDVSGEDLGWRGQNSPPATRAANTAAAPPSTPAPSASAPTRVTTETEASTMAICSAPTTPSNRW
ncbi:MAG: hypothetical protein J0H91_22745 [Rhodospirillales bacterium]|nr:hypothetical protein [Rhodospirillales bacterium]